MRLRKPCRCRCSLAAALVDESRGKIGEANQIGELDEAMPVDRWAAPAAARALIEPDD